MPYPWYVKPAGTAGNVTTIIMGSSTAHTARPGASVRTGSRMNGIKTGLGITPGEHIISADSALSRNIRHCFCLSCHGRLILQTDAQGAWFEHDLHALSEQQKGKRAARTVLTGMCYSVGSATRQGSSSPTRFIGQSAMTSRT